jgi:hypothetical protein
VDIHERLDWAFSTFSVFNVKDKQKVRKLKYREKVVCAEFSAVKYIPGSGPKRLHRSFLLGGGAVCRFSGRLFFHTCTQGQKLALEVKLLRSEYFLRLCGRLT